MTGLKVAHVINIDVGIRVHLRNQLLYLQEAGYDVIGVCAPGPLVPESGVTPEGIRVYTVPMSREITPWQDLKTVARLISLFRQENVDIVHTHSVKPGLLGRLAARLAGVPCVIHTVHGVLHDNIRPTIYWIWKLSEKAGAMLGDYMLSQSRQDMDILIQEKICRPNKLGYLGNGIRLADFDPQTISPAQIQALRQEHGIQENEKLIAIVARLVAQKGYFEFAEMARRVHQTHPETKFWIIGRPETDKSEGLDIEQIITPDMHSYTRYLGYRADMPLIYAATDIFVFPSFYSEGVPRSLLEASAMGKPIIASDIRGCREVIEDGQTGILFRVQDTLALIGAVINLLESPKLAMRIGQAARAHAMANFDERTYFATLTSTYERLAAQKNLAKRQQ